ncbi:MAG: hemerythrin domain-containing protein [Kofleriaceae bacterium]
MTSSSTAAQRHHSPLYLYMVRSHTYLRELLAQVIAAMEANERTNVDELWTKLDHGLLTHMEAEERFVLPVFAHVDPSEARELLREHGLLREELLELGIAVDLHCVRCDRSRDFADILMRHAAREEALLYRWAEQHLQPTLIDKIREHVGSP